jgi:hypothetical protein
MEAEETLVAFARRMAAERNWLAVLREMRRRNVVIDSADHRTARLAYLAATGEDEV